MTEAACLLLLTRPMLRVIPLSPSRRRLGVTQTSSWNPCSTSAVYPLLFKLQSFVLTLRLEFLSF